MFSIQGFLTCESKLPEELQTPCIDPVNTGLAAKGDRLGYA